LFGQGINGREYICLTDMASDAEGRLDKYLEAAKTQEFLSELQNSPGFGGVQLIDTKQGRNGGTWAVGEVAQHFAMWLAYM
jgi:hypothetical protein